MSVLGSRPTIFAGAAAAEEADGDLFRVLDDVIVRDDEAVLRDDETASLALLLEPRFVAGQGRQSEAARMAGRKQAFEADGGAGLDADDGGGHARGQIGEARGDPNGLGLLDPALRTPEGAGPGIPLLIVVAPEEVDRAGGSRTEAGRAGVARRAEEADNEEGERQAPPETKMRRMEKGSFVPVGRARPPGWDPRPSRAPQTVAPVATAAIGAGS